MAAERFFTKLTNEVLEATEQVATRLEESLTLVFGGNVAKTPAEFSDAPTHEDVGDLEGALRDNPLQGMADSVLGKILDSQVSLCSDDLRAMIGLLYCLTLYALSQRR